MDQKQFTIAVALITNDKGEVLLGKRNQPEDPVIHNKWEFPGGGIEFGEDAEAAVMREALEETGLKVEVKRLLSKVYSNTWEHTGRQVFLLAYECKIVGGELKMGDPEIGELKYFKPSDIDYTNSLPKTKEIIDLLSIH